MEEISQAAGEMRTKASLKAAMRGTVYTPPQYVVRPEDGVPCSAALQSLVPAIAEKPNMTSADVADHAAQYISKLDVETAELIDKLRYERLRRRRLMSRVLEVKAEFRRDTLETKAAKDRKRRRIIKGGEDWLRAHVPTLAKTSPRQNVAIEAARYIQALRCALTPNHLRSIDAAFTTIITNP